MPADRGLSRGVIAVVTVLACFAALGASDAPALGTGRMALIRGGEAAKPGELPSLAFIAYLIPNEKGEAIVCTGTVLSARLVLTAAHCVKPPEVRVSVENFRVITGDVNWKAPDRQVLHVARAIGYPRYDSRSGQGDAALLELSEPTEAPPMPLAGRRFWSAGSEAEIAGWGKVHLGQHGVTYLLHRASIAVLGSRECRLQGGRRGQVCAEDTPPRKASPCYGDSGGPLLAHRPGGGGLVEIGVVHGGANCNPRFPGLFTSTVPIFDWVRARMREVRSP